MTSGEYAYDLLRRLQRHFRCTESGSRMYLYNFFGEVFNDPSVVITESAYNAFCEQMDADGKYYAEQGLTSLYEIYNSSGFKESWAMLQGSFASIGITIEYVVNMDTGYIDFTLPNGNMKRLDAYSGLTSSYLCARTGAEYSYAQRMIPYYEFKGEPVRDLSQMKTNVSGYGTYWEYDGNGEVEITGQGSLASTELFNDLGIRSAVTTVVIGSGVNRFLLNSLYFPNKNVSFVFLHGSADKISFAEGFASSSTATTPSYYYDIYTDNETVRGLTFPSNISVTFHRLDEWNIGG